MTDIPRKLSVDDLKNPELSHWVMRVRVFVDGVEQDACIRYDMDAGEVERYMKDKDGKLVTDGRAAVHELVKGVVTVELRDEAAS